MISSEYDLVNFCFVKLVEDNAVLNSDFFICAMEGTTDTGIHWAFEPQGVSNIVEVGPVVPGGLPKHRVFGVPQSENS